MASYITDAFERLRDKPNEDLTLAMRSFQECHNETAQMEQLEQLDDSDRIYFDIQHKKCDENLLNVLKRTNLTSCTVYCPAHNPKRDAM